MNLNSEQKIIYEAFIKYQSMASRMKATTKKKRKSSRDELFRSIDKCVMALKSSSYTQAEKNTAYNKGRLLYQHYCSLRRTYPELITCSLDNKVDQLLNELSIQAIQYIDRFRKSEIGGTRINIDSIFNEDANIKKLMSQPMDRVLKDALSDRRFSIVSKVDQKVYITQSGQKYHRANCPYCKRCKLIETTHSKVSNAGYEPCRCIGTTEKVHINPQGSASTGSNEMDKGVLSVFIDESVRKSYWSTLDPRLDDKQSSYSYIICEGFLENENQITEKNTLYKNACLANEALDTTYSAIEAISTVLLKLAFNYDFHGDVVIYTDNTGAVDKWYKVNSNQFLAEQFESVRIAYIPRDQNKKADAVGRAMEFSCVPVELIDLIKQKLEAYSRIEEELNFVKNYFPKPRYNIPNLLEELRLLADEKGGN